MSELYEAIKEKADQARGDGFPKTAIELDGWAESLEKLEATNAALLAACKLSLDILGSEQINSKALSEQDSKIFDAVLHLVAAIKEAEL